MGADDSGVLVRWLALGEFTEAWFNLSRLAKVC